MSQEVKATLGLLQVWEVHGGFSFAGVTECNFSTSEALRLELVQV